MRNRRKPAHAGDVRIIGGDWRRRRIAVASDASVRPTPDRVRETLFNWLEPHVGGADCLDLFAGTGVLGFEALSRGARSVQFVERDARLAAALRACAEALGANARIARASAEEWLARPADRTFGIVFLDPPYAEQLEPYMAALAPRLAREALVYVERAGGAGLPELADFDWHRTSRAGEVAYGLAVRRA